MKSKRLILVILISVVLLLDVWVFQSKAQTQDGQFGTWENKQQILLICSQVIEEFDIIRELEIVEGQRHVIATVFDEFRSSTRELGIEAKRRILQLAESDLSDDERNELTSRWKSEFDAQIEKKAGIVLEKLAEHLLPHQIHRLQQLAYQRILFASAGGDRTKMFLNMAKELELSPRELEKFELAAAKIGESFNKQLAELRRKHDQQIIAALPAAASKRAKELLGPIYLNAKAVTNNNAMNRSGEASRTRIDK